MLKSPVKSDQPDFSLFKILAENSFKKMERNTSPHLQCGVWPEVQHETPRLTVEQMIEVGSLQTMKRERSESHLWPLCVKASSVRVCGGPPDQLWGGEGFRF